MRAVVCRVSSAHVTVDGQVVGRVDRGLLVYVGVVCGDDAADVSWMADKLISLRAFPDDQGKMNRSVTDVAGGLLLIPNFTLAGRTRKGTRPSFTDAAPPEVASALFDQLAARCAQRAPVATGVFGAYMTVTADCDGPITLVIDSPQRPQHISPPSP